jgi:hypothetical protein
LHVSSKGSASEQFVPWSKRWKLRPFSWNICVQCCRLRDATEAGQVCRMTAASSGVVALLGLWGQRRHRDVGGAGRTAE